jgi:hypothetical protein
MVAVGLGRLAYVLARAGQMVMAARLLASSESLTRGLGARSPWPWHVKRNDETRLMIRATLDEVAFARASEEGRGLSEEEALEQAFGPRLDGGGAVDANVEHWPT